MAATETRLLLLGAVAIFEPVNGYQIRRELLSWNVDDWAHIRPGSIYSGLTTLSGQGYLARHDLRDGTRQVAVYQLTDRGREEFDRLFAVSLETYDPTAPVPFHTAMSLLPLVRREVFLAHLRTRLANVEEAHRQAEVQREEADVLPPHVTAMLGYWQGMGGLELEWLRELLASVAGGALDFAGEPSTWRPADDDPGWQMAADRERYRGLLGG